MPFKKMLLVKTLLPLLIFSVAGVSGYTAGAQQLFSNSGRDLPQQLAQTGATPNVTERAELTATARPKPTERARPTSTPSPTANPDKVVSVETTYYVTVPALNVRSGPDTTFPIVQTLSLGMDVRASAIVNDNWIKGEYAPNKVGFLFKGGMSQTRPAPTPTPVPIEAVIKTGKYVDVNLTTQVLRAFNAGVVEYETYISSGLKGYETPTGTFAVYARRDSQTMKGGSVEKGDYFNLDNVQYVQYFTGEYALHGAYWHNNFGTPMSHGCVNLSNTDAQWLYGWAGIGTVVVVHY